MGGVGRISIRRRFASPLLIGARRASSSRAGSELEPNSKAKSKPEKKLRDRLSAVIDAVNNRKLPPQLRARPNSTRSETDIVNVVEQRIWHSMEQGQFENLPRKGKPLEFNTNPYADPAEDTLYRILSKNGCAPEWIELNKDIRFDANKWRLDLKRAWSDRSNGEYSKWNEAAEALKVQMRVINDKYAHDLKIDHVKDWDEKRSPLSDSKIRWVNLKVFRYNLIAPFGRQMFGLKWEKEIDQLERL